LLLSELLQLDVIKVGLEARNKEEAIGELVDLLVAAHEIRLHDRPIVLEAVMARERSTSTGLKYGLAVPHGTVDCVTDILAALGTSKAGIPFDSVDGEPAKLLILLVIPRGTFPQHVGTLAGISGLATRTDLQQLVLGAGTAEEVLAAIHEMEGY
jgi:mannitol/fructose-specific phosphotransferase system IIA component (Ntr-type)